MLDATTTSVIAITGKMSRWTGKEVIQYFLYADGEWPTRVVSEQTGADGKWPTPRGKRKI
jgi:hypothetical protein